MFFFFKNQYGHVVWYCCNEDAQMTILFQVSLGFEEEETTEESLRHV